MAAWGYGESPVRRIFVALAVFAVAILVTDLVLVTNIDVGGKIRQLSLPGKSALDKLGGGSRDGNESTSITLGDDESGELANDGHPIQRLMKEASEKFRKYDADRSRTFAQVVSKYRAKYGRHPPPNFDKWYRFARERNVYHLDDFDQINDDLRPFWSIPPAELRRQVKGLLAEDYTTGRLGGIHVRRGVATPTDDHWRTTEFARMVKVFAKYLPDMDIAMNRLDQPRVVVPWEDLQQHLQREEASRVMHAEVTNEFSEPDPIWEASLNETDPLPTGEWFTYHSKPYMDLVAPACPPESYARMHDKGMTSADADKLYKLEHTAGLIKNFNLSSDLCTVGPQIANLHGFLFAASTVVASRKLIPVFGECKVNVNNDILFPANMYYKTDARYDYSPDKDVPWADKAATLFWRGITSGGVQTPEGWRQMHRHRLVLLTNSTYLSLSTPPATAPILVSSGASSSSPSLGTSYTETLSFTPAPFAQKHTDVGFPEIVWCVPDDTCAWLKAELREVPATTQTEQFQYKYLIDVDGHSFSGRWNAFLKSASLGLKSTIFREWHDSRLHAWHHFVPVDNRFDDLYALMTYFVGLGSPPRGSEGSNWKEDALAAAANGGKEGEGEGEGGGYYVPAHDAEAETLARNSMDWARKVLRREDMEVYVFRLMLEYARLLDERRDDIGYGGDGREVDERKGWGWRA